MKIFQATSTFSSSGITLEKQTKEINELKDTLSNIESDYKSKIFDIEMKLNESIEENKKMKILKDNEINSKKDEISVLLVDISTINDLCTLGSKKLEEKQNEFDHYRAIALLVRIFCIFFFCAIHIFLFLFTFFFFLFFFFFYFLFSSFFIFFYFFIPFLFLFS